MRKIFALALLAAASAAQAGGIESLDHFIKSAKTGRADFTQVVTSPARDGQVARSKTSSGSFEFARPSRFRFDYRKPFQQAIVADGQTLWLHDADLNQVTARKQAQVLDSTPAALIAAAPDLASLQREFNLEPAPDRDGLQWVTATPRAKEGQINSVKIGFRGQELAALDILDGLGQRSVMTFSKMELNVPISPTTFQFKPPQGADVSRQ